MARWAALMLGVVVVGLMGFVVVPQRAVVTAQDDRIADLEARVRALEVWAADDSPFTLTCAGGEIVADAFEDGGGGLPSDGPIYAGDLRHVIHLSWDGGSPMSWGSGAVFRDCTAT